MPDTTLSSVTPDLKAEAASWIAQLETGDLSRADLAAFQEWVRRSPAHYSAIVSMAKLSQSANVLTDFKAPLEHTLRRRRDASAGVLKSGALTWRGAVIACAAIFVVSFAGFSYFNTEPTPDPYLLVTQVGEFNEHFLSDGSIVKINTNSQIEVDFDQGERRIRLLKGEAFFDVKHNPERPFIVSADDKSVKAVGTAFSVRWTDGDLSVVVSEGKVAVQPMTEVSKTLPLGDRSNTDNTQRASPETPLFLTAGQKLSLTRGQDIDTPTEQKTVLVAEYDSLQIKHELSWRSGVLDFSGKPLSEVLQDLHRYTDVRFVIVDPEISAVEYSGVVWTDQATDKQVSDVLQAMGLILESADGNRVLIKQHTQNK